MGRLIARVTCSTVPVPCSTVPVPLVPVGQPVRPQLTGATPPAANLRRRAGELVATQFDTVAAVAEEYALVATGAMPTGVWR